MRESVQTQRYDNNAAAEYIGLAPQTLNRWRGEGRGPRFMKLGSRVVYDQADLDEWLAANRHQSTSEYERAHDSRTSEI